VHQQELISTTDPTPLCDQGWHAGSARLLRQLLVDNHSCVIVECKRRRPHEPGDGGRSR